MSYLIKILKKHFAHLVYFYGHLKYRLLVTLVLSLIVATLDGFGLAMFLPLLQLADGGFQVEAHTLGNLRFLVDAIETMGINLTIYTVLVVILMFFLLKGVAKFFEAYYKVIVQQYFISKIRVDNVSHLSNFSYKAFVLADSGRIQNTLSGEVGRVALAYQYYMATLQALVMVFVYVALAFMTNPEFAVLVTAGGLLSNLAFRQLYNKTKSASSQVTNDGHVYQGLLIQQVGFFKYLKATGLLTLFSNKLKDYILRIEESNRKMGYNSAILTGAREPILVLVVVGVIVVQVSYFSDNIAMIILSLLFFYRSLTFLMSVQTFWNGFVTSSGAIQNMTDFTNELIANRERQGNDEISKLSSQIMLVNVGFSFGDKQVLRDVNLTIRRNQTVAFVGESGSGKTTLVNLVAGLILPTSGDIFIDKKSITDLRLRSWQQRIGYITQESVIFNDTVFNNVTFWAEPTEENLKRFWIALEKASISDFVKQLPQQEESFLGTGGVLVSGGQRQRLSIARELFKDIDVLIMDEATSALDSETEQVIQENIDQLKGHLTILIIAHRLSTVRNADCVVLLNNGSIDGVGSFSDLKHVSTRFERMVEMQDI